ncbi:MAG: hypothetical protein L0229_12235 [Blastocatellia bacterium]|nr:hypothetical protein [Blastocatellia bacterium]
MRKLNRASLIAGFAELLFVIASFAQNHAAGDHPPVRRSDESLQDFAMRIIPSGKKLVHQALEGNFGPSGANLVILFGDEEFKPFTGWVLAPVKGRYEKFVLPEPEYSYSMEEVKAVFYANADRDKERELLILSECYTGVGPTGAQPFYQTRVYDWNGNGFSYRGKVSEKIGNASNARQVRSKLKALGFGT